MSYVIGVGLLIDGKPFNTLRQISMQLADETGNYNGLGQPPHVTIKRPFSVPDKTTIDGVILATDKFAKNLSTIQIEFEGFECFGKEVIYARVQNNEQLRAAHDSALKKLSLYFHEIDAHEGSEIVFHSTIAMGLSPSEHQAAMKKLSDLSPKLPKEVESRELGVFLAINDTQDWAVIHKSKLSGHDN